MKNPLLIRHQKQPSNYSKGNHFKTDALSAHNFSQEDTQVHNKCG